MTDRATAVDRTSSVWKRIRWACVHASRDIDLDEHADNVYRTIVARLRQGARKGMGRK